jgi:hypothetical protein
VDVIVLARLDRATGLKVLCGSIGNTCRGELARVAIVPAAVTFEERELTPGDRLLCMLDGWVKHPPLIPGEPPRLTLSDHERQRAQRVTAAVRRGEADRELLADARRPRHRRPITNVEDFDTIHLYSGGQVIRDILRLGHAGILADCPLCPRVNTLTAEQLRVVPL